jgi:hypothetical protein
MQAAEAKRYHRIEVPMALAGDGLDLRGDIGVSEPRDPVYHSPEEEIAYVLYPF